MSNQIEQIRAEIERRISENTFGAKLELIDLLAWLDTLTAETIPSGVQEAAENSEIIFSTDGELTIYSFVGAPRWWATIREAEEALSVFKAGAKNERERLMKEAVEGTLGYGPHLLRPIVMLEQVPKIWDGSSSNPVSVIIIKKEK